MRNWSDTPESSPRRKKRVLKNVELSSTLPRCRCCCCCRRAFARLFAWLNWNNLFLYIFFCLLHVAAAAFCSGQKINFLSLQFSSSFFLTSSNSCEYFSSLCSGLLFFCRLPHTRCFFCFKNLIKSTGYICDVSAMIFCCFFLLC